MTKNEMGLKLRQRYPKLNELPYSNEELAQWCLNEDESLYDILSPTARRAKELSNTGIGYVSTIFTSSRAHGDLYAQAVQTRRAELQYLHETDLVIEASSRGIPVTALAEIAIESHKTDEFIRKETFIMTCGLEGTRENALRPHHLLARRRAEVNALIDEFDKETHPKKRQALEILINAGLEELRGRANQAVVQSGGRELGRDNPDADTPRSSGESHEGDVEPISIKGFRMGE